VGPEGASPVRHRSPRRPLQVADSTTDLAVLRITGGLPERSSHLVLEGDQGGYSTGTAAAQVLLAGPRQRDPDALLPLPFANSEPIHVPPLSVPSGDQGADDLLTASAIRKAVARDPFRRGRMAGGSCQATRIHNPIAKARAEKLLVKRARATD
jgi:hypothetical protein